MSIISIEYGRGDVERAMRCVQWQRFQQQLLEINLVTVAYTVAV